MKSLQVIKGGPVHSHGTLAALMVLALTWTCPAPAREGAGDADALPTVPAILQVPAGDQLFYHVVGVGVQIYVWTQNPTTGTSSWVFQAPQAVLLNEHGEVVGHHYAGPTWESIDGSKVVGTVLQRSPSPTATTAIPWLLLAAKTNIGTGVFSSVSFIQRLNTVGGLAPTTPGVNVGDLAQVPYMADYFFYQRAGTIYKTGFEAPTFVAGLSLVGQDGWVVGATPGGPLSPAAPVISTDPPHIGPQTVRVNGGDLVHQDFITSITGGYYDAIGSYRRPVNYNTGNKVAVRVSAMVRVDGPQTPAGNNFFSAGVTGRALLTDGNGTAGLGELDLSSDGHVYGWSGDSFVPTFEASVPATLGDWHKLSIVADFVASTYSFSVDDQSLGTFPFPPQSCGDCFTSTFLRGSLLAYAAPDTATLQRSNYAAHYDNFVIEVVSESDNENEQ